MKNHFVEFESATETAAKIQLIIGTLRVVQLRRHEWLRLDQLLTIRQGRARGSPPDSSYMNEAMAVIRNSIVSLQAAQLPISR